MMVDEVTVMASYLEPSGPTYQVLARVPLAGD
jgi:2'-5' RNA ligase